MVISDWMLNKIHIQEFQCCAKISEIERSFIFFLTENNKYLLDSFW